MQCNEAGAAQDGEHFPFSQLVDARGGHRIAVGGAQPGALTHEPSLAHFYAVALLESPAEAVGRTAERKHDIEMPAIGPVVEVGRQRHALGLCNAAV